MFGGYEEASALAFSANGSKYGFAYKQNGKENKKPYDQAAFTINNSGIVVIGYIKDNYVFLEKIEN